MGHRVGTVAGRRGGTTEASAYPLVPSRRPARMRERASAARGRVRELRPPRAQSVRVSCGEGGGALASARTPAPAPAAVAPHRAGPTIRDGQCRFDSCAESPVPTSVDPARPLRRSASPLRPEPVRAPARISRSSAPCCPACPPPLPS